MAPAAFSGSELELAEHTHLLKVLLCVRVCLNCWREENCARVRPGVIVACRFGMSAVNGAKCKQCDESIFPRSSAAF